MTWPNYTAACRKDVNDLLKRGGSLSAYRANKLYGAGPSEGSWAYRLERDLEKRFKVRHAVAVNSGTAALHCALSALDLKGGEVVTSPYTFSATVSAILMAGGKPVFADVNHFSLTIGKEEVKRVITRRTKAILPVHLFGGLAACEELQEFGLPVIEDACQAVGARRGSSYSGTVGVAGAYSFNGGKNVPAGECGCLVTNSGKVAEQARLLMNHAENFGTKYVGYNYRPNEVTCCIAWHGLQELEERNKRRQELASIIRAKTWATVIGAFSPSTVGEDHAFYVYPFRVLPGTRDLFIQRMKKRGITVGAGYIQPPLHHYKAFRKYATRELPVVDELSFKTLCLLYDLTPDKPLSYAAHVAKCMREALCE